MAEPQTRALSRRAMMPTRPGASPRAGAAATGSSLAVGDAFDSHDSWDLPADGSSLDESGEIYVAPFGSGECSNWKGVAETDSGVVESCPTDLPGSVGLPIRRSAATARSEHRLSRFEIIDLLGEGRHAIVYRAFDPLLERQVALKLPRREGKLRARALERLLGEARALARLRHPRIVPIYEAGHDGDRHYIAMALIEGPSLAEQIVGQQLAWQRSAEIVAELAEAVAYAHGVGIIHRDIKPANIRIDHTGAAYLMDFGLAYLSDSGEIPAPPGTIQGTPAYLAPEHAQGVPASLLPASDQYSLGAVLYELLSGRPPFLGPPSSVLLNVVHSEPTPLRTIVPKMPRALAAICRKAMAKRPERRYASCLSLAEELRRWLRGETARPHRLGLGWGGPAR
jgi:tRNA A-37 threonylcarbamoyl transferase component Bud32